MSVSLCYAEANSDFCATASIPLLHAGFGSVTPAPMICSVHASSSHDKNISEWGVKETDCFCTDVTTCLGLPADGGFVLFHGRRAVAGDDD